MRTKGAKGRVQKAKKRYDRLLGKFKKAKAEFTKHDVEQVIDAHDGVYLPFARIWEEEGKYEAGLQARNMF